MKGNKILGTVGLFIFLMMTILLFGVLIWYTNYNWVQNNCYNSLINASSNIIERCGVNGIYP